MKRKGLYLSLGIGTPVAVIILWWVLSASSTNTFFPPLQSILIRFRELWMFEHFSSDVLPSLRNLIIGYAIASVVGIGVGFIFALVPVARKVIEPLIHFLRSIPPVALIPIFISLIGFGVEMRVATIALSALFPTLIATIDGIKSVEQGLKDVSAVYRLDWSQRIFSVYLPAATPRIAAGMQVSLQVAFIVMIASEMLGPSAGIGAMTLLAQQSFMIADMWAGILLLGIIGFVANMIFELVKRRVLSWYFSSRKLERAA